MKYKYMNITENLQRIKEGKDNIIKSLKNKGVDIPDNTLINEIPTIIDNVEIGGGGGDTPVQPDVPELVQKYEGATVFRIEVPTDNYEFSINLCNDASKATYDVDWGDGNLESGLTTDEQHHTYSKAGIYDVNIYNISKDITLGGYYNTAIINGNYKYIYYLFNNTNNDFWSGTYIENKEYVICTNILIGKGIYTFGDYAFKGCTSLQSIVIPEGVKSIGDYAFQGCISLQSIVIPNSVTHIGYNAFQGCISLQSIVIPEGVKSIGEYAFQGCISLQSIVIPEGVTHIGYNAFSGCNSLISINIPDSLTSIGSYAFSGCNSLISINIPDSVTSIGSDAFSGCNSLISINIPKNVTSIVSYAFKGCYSLQNINIPDSVTSIGSDAFYGCMSLQNIDLSNVSSIGSLAFYNCISLQSITFNGKNTPTIQSNSFPTSNFKYIKRYLYVPKDSVGYDSGNFKTYLLDKGWELRYIEDRVKTPTTLKLKTTNNFLHDFKAIGQANLVDYELIDNEYIYHFDDKIPELAQYTFYNKVLEDIELPEGLEIIGNNTFQTCSSLQSIVIPDSVTTIGNYAFQICYSLQSIVIPDSVTTIGNYAFKGCYSLQSIVIPDSVTTIGNNTFQTCSSLQSIVIPDSVTTIGNYAFQTCSSLQSIVIPDSVTTIGNYAFKGCTSLQSIVIPETIKSIESYTFQTCSSLQSIVIPDSVTSIGNYAFDGCSKLSTITCKAMTAPTIQSKTFFDIGSNVPSGTPKILRVPEGADYSTWLSKLSGFTLEYVPLSEL